MRELFVVSREFPAATELDIVIFTSKTKAVKKFKEFWREVELNDRKSSHIDIKKDEEEEKEYFYYDGSYGLTIQMKKVEIGKMFSAF